MRSEHGEVLLGHERPPAYYYKISLTTNEKSRCLLHDYIHVFVYLHIYVIIYILLCVYYVLNYLFAYLFPIKYIGKQVNEYIINTQKYINNFSFVVTDIL